MVAGGPCGEGSVFFGLLQSACPVVRARQQGVRTWRDVFPLYCPADPRARSEWRRTASFAPGGSAVVTHFDVGDTTTAGERDSAHVEPGSSDAGVVGGRIDAGNCLDQCIAVPAASDPVAVNRLWNDLDSGDPLRVLHP